MLEEMSSFYKQQGFKNIAEQRLTPAIAALKKAAQLQVQDAQIQNALGLCCFRLGEFEQAKGAWERSVELFSENNPAVHYLAELKQDDFSCRIQSYNEALDLAGKRCYKQAERILKQKKQMTFSFVSFGNLLGLCFYGRKREKEALKVWLRVLSLDREHPLTLRYLQQGFCGSNGMQQQARRRRLFLFW